MRDMIRAMGKLIPFRRPQPRSAWTRIEAYRRPKPRGQGPAARARRLTALLVGLPLAAFAVVLLWPAGGAWHGAGEGERAAGAAGVAGQASAAGAAEVTRRQSLERSAAALDAAQPQVAAGLALAAGSAPEVLAGVDRERAYFSLCSGPVRVTCVVDGDTIWYRGEKIRLADLDTPEVSRPGCAREAALGRKATRRLQALLNAGPFTLEANPAGHATDNYGRSLKLVTRGGESLGAVLVREGLAEQWGGPRRAWC
ncbi:MAG: thermonuclease family protein [Erythrobacter cryptus]